MSRAGGTFEVLGLPNFVQAHLLDLDKAELLQDLYQRADYYDKAVTMFGKAEA
jgi:hypothetical protein